MGEFTLFPVGCPASYSATVDPAASFMTQLASGRGMKWATSNEADVGTYTVTVTATSEELSESTTYTVEILS